MKVYNTVEDCIIENGYCDSREHFIRYQILMYNGVYNVVVDGHWKKSFGLWGPAQEYLNKFIM